MPSASRRKNGRPTKRTEVVLKPLFAAIRIGVPYKLACMAAGISYDCFSNWRREDPVFDAEVEHAAAEPAVKLFKTIREQALETWQAGAWALERRYPEMFAKPEAQLNVVATAQAAAPGPTNVVVVGPERAAILLSRHEKIRARTIELVNKAGAGQGERPAGSESGNGQSEVVARQAELPVLEPVDSASEFPEKPSISP